MNEKTPTILAQTFGAMPPAKKARVEVGAVNVEIEIDEGQISADLVCPCNAAHVYKNAEGFEKHKNSKTHIAFEKWKKTYDSNEQKNNKILLCEKEKKISSLEADLRHQNQLTDFNFQKYQVVSCQLHTVNQNCIDCVNAYPGLLHFFPYHAAHFQQQWSVPCPPSDPPPPPPESVVA